jgi:hypothetical protein
MLAVLYMPLVRIVYVLLLVLPSSSRIRFFISSWVVKLCMYLVLIGFIV